MSWIKQKENQEKELRRTLRSISNYMYPAFETIVSIDTTKETQFFTLLEKAFKVKNLTKKQEKELLNSLNRLTERIVKEDGGVGFNSDKWQRYLNSQGRKKAKEITDVISRSRDDVIKEIRKGLKNSKGSNWVERFENFKKEYKTIDMQTRKKNIVERIARTESHKIHSEFQSDIYKRSGVKFKKWVNLEGARDTHQTAGRGKAIRIDKYFTVGTDRMLFPGGGSQAKENVNCRCYLKPVGNFKEI